MITNFLLTKIQFSTENNEKIKIGKLGFKQSLNCFPSQIKQIVTIALTNATVKSSMALMVALNETNSVTLWLLAFRKRRNKQLIKIIPN